MPNDVKRGYVDMTLDFLREPIRETREAAHRHAHGQVPAFYIRRADLFRIGLTLDLDFLDASTAGGAAAALGAVK